MSQAKQPDSQHQFSQLEEQMLRAWEREDTFRESVRRREGAERFSFFDGPPYANGLPHHGHVVPSLVKDAVARYKTMRGYHVPRVAGWDCHGLPVEQKIEQELGFNSRQEIEDYGIDKFNQACRESVFRYQEEWEQFITRLGRWVDLENAYATLENSYIESIWWVFSRIWEQGLVYEDFKSMPYCPRCATPLANFEVSQGYTDTEDPSIYVKFALHESQAQLLAWTTTPWTLPGNVALAVDPGATYVEVSHHQDRLILARERLDVLGGQYHVEREFSGAELVGSRYEPLFALNEAAVELNDQAYTVQAAEFVGLEEGTGIVHIAPAFGADDLALGQEHNLPLLDTVDSQGFIRNGLGLGQAEGTFFKDADPILMDQLGDKLYHSEVITHSYPFCWRCDSPLLYYAITTWFIKTDAKQLTRNNQRINWVPEHIKTGRFGKWLEGARDWSFSRNRYWGAPLPIWRTEDGETIVISSIDELKERAVNPEQIDDLHRPYIDEVVVRTDDGREARRVEEVFDVWFESGAMPYASNHYPFQNQEDFENIFPADFIAESIDQTRGWFYTLHTIASLLYDKPAFWNVVVSGWVVAADGQKLSKKLKNYTPVNEVFERFGADTLRYFMATSPVVNAEDVGFSTDYLRDVQRNVFSTLWNSYRFFTTYAQVDGWTPSAELAEPQTQNLLDAWMVSRVQKTVAEVTKQADEYQMQKAAIPVRELIDDLSNWYVRRSRRRFWKSEDDSDKQSAYATLHYTLIRVCQLLAPWAPFMSDHIYRELCGENMPTSVHLTDWPEAEAPDKQLLERMQTVREVVSQGLDQRAQAGVKVRQPLGSVTLNLGDTADAWVRDFSDIIREELNVKTLELAEQGEQVVLDTELTPELKREGLARDVVRQVQQTRKRHDLNVDDRIQLTLNSSDAELLQAIEEHQDTIAAETLAHTLQIGADGQEDTHVDGRQMSIGLKVANTE